MDMPKEPKIILLVVALVILGLLRLLFVRNMNIEKQHEQATNNLRIHRSAVAANDPSICEKISGEGYGFGPTDGLIFVSEETAKQWCRDDADRGFIANRELLGLINSKLGAPEEVCPGENCTLDVNIPY